MNPILQPSSVLPTSSDFVVHGVFNPAAAFVPPSQETTSSVILILRVSESYKPHEGNDGDDHLYVPVAKPSRGVPSVARVAISRQDPLFDTTSDARVVLRSADRRVAYLTSLSHLRVARSADGIHFDVDKKPLLFPALAAEEKEGDGDSNDDDESALAMEEWGVEDARVVRLEDFDPMTNLPPECRPAINRGGGGGGGEWEYAVTYTAVSRYGAATALALTTRDFTYIKRLGLIFPPENKDVCLFPSRVRGHWYCYHRPVPRSFGNPDMWCAMSDNLVSWGMHKHILGSRSEVASAWDNGRVGGGAPSVRCSKGWLHVYHAANIDHQYCLGVFLADPEDPGKIIARAKRPILSPTEPYERVGFFPNVVFSCGVILLPRNQLGGGKVEEDADEQLLVYYGAADDKVALCAFRLGDIYDLLEEA